MLVYKHLFEKSSEILDLDENILCRFVFIRNETGQTQAPSRQAMTFFCIIYHKSEFLLQRLTSDQHFLLLLSTTRSERFYICSAGCSVQSIQHPIVPPLDLSRPPHGIFDILQLIVGQLFFLSHLLLQYPKHRDGKNYFPHVTRQV